MLTDYWINLPVKDLDRSKRFFTQIGMAFDESSGAPSGMAALRIGQQQMPIMLIEEARFREFAAIDAVSTGTSLLISLGVESRQDVDDIASRVESAGGRIFGRPSENGSMYGAGFADLDGHLWNLLHM